MTAPAADPLLELACAGRTVARYRSGTGLPHRLAPRPYLHPVTTLGGVTVTEERPEDHLHHLGVSVTVADVAGYSFWGGRTFVRDRGPVELDNHGTQRHTGWLRHGPDHFTQELAWEAGGTELLRERRTVAAVALPATPLSPAAWALDVECALSGAADVPVRIGSPATNGRPGAAYGGFFWRAPKEAAPPRVFTADAEGEDAVHGTRAGWLALAGDGWTLVFAAADAATRADPWFVRAAEYPGVGSSLASARPLTVPPREAVVRRIVTVVADGRLDREAAAALAGAATGARRPTEPPADGT
ncbi:PmoA family protein [Streptomyces sp. TRM 70351]|uniref:DUF6807 domain-containing protein n=1 Tax=Streptomyces sp. TRM 70351 TaxID=3116552 RepID=UPI002E7B3258|nr:PmoA family protein [Streptomyces sp. TRM 70351]MEE1928292.1 PmoA family protein [Streptomyces sp. TRM 70351]